MSTPGPMRTLGKVKKGAKTAGSAPGGGDKPPDKPYQKPTPAPEVDVPSSEEEDEEEEEDQNTKYTDRYSVMPPKGEVSARKLPNEFNKARFSKQPPPHLNSKERNDYAKAYKRLHRPKTEKQKHPRSYTSANAHARRDLWDLWETARTNSNNSTAPTVGQSGTANTASNDNQAQDEQTSPDIDDTAMESSDDEVPVEQNPRKPRKDPEARNDKEGDPGRHNPRSGRK